jgi:hypothetical protein
VVPIFLATWREKGKRTAFISIDKAKEIVSWEDG